MSSSKLALAEEIVESYGVDVSVIAVDLTHPHAGEKIDAETNGLDVGLVVLNAGAAMPGAFLKQPWEERQRNIALNVTAPLELTHRFGQRLVARGGGGVLLVSSMVGYTGAPYMSSYAASKGLLLQFGQALAVEWNKHNVDVTVLAPGATRTPMTSIEEVNMDSLPMPWMGPDRAARIGLRALGRKTAVIAGKRNRLMTASMRMMPRRMALAAFGSMMRGATAEELR